MCYYFSKTKSVSMAREHSYCPEKMDDAYEAELQEKKEGEVRTPDTRLAPTKEAA